MADDNVEEFDSSDEEDIKTTNLPAVNIGGENEDEEELDPEKMDEFEYQLKLEELEKKRLAKQSADAGSSRIYTDPKDGTVYEWDDHRQGWFPKIDEDFIAKYQANYGSHPLDLTQVASSEQSLAVRPQAIDPQERKEQAKQEKRAKRKLAAEKAKESAKSWFDVDDEHNRNVYISNLPLNITMVEYQELMSKCGLIASELGTKNLKLKLYKDHDGNLKGDGLCCYIKVESVELALEILDGSLVGGNTIRVERAHFQQKGDFDPAKKKKRLTAKQKKQLKEKQEKLLDWRPEKLRGERSKHECTVVLKNAFTLQEFAENAARLLELKDELKAECSKYGEVKKVQVYDNNAEGVVTIAFNTAEEADDCITMMNYRVFHGKQLSAATWDGKTKYKIEETKEEEERRLTHWREFLEREQEEAASAKSAAFTAATAE